MPVGAAGSVVESEAPLGLAEADRLVLFAGGGAVATDGRVVAPDGGPAGADGFTLLKPLIFIFVHACKSSMLVSSSIT